MKHPKNKYANDVHCIIDEADAPKELWEISEKWRELADAEGDVGSCVMGAGFIFKYQKKWYFLIPRSRWQGSISWEKHIDTIHKALEALGVTDLRYDWGHLD